MSLLLSERMKKGYILIITHKGKMKKIVFLRGQKPNPRFCKRLDLLKNDFISVLIYWEKSSENADTFYMDQVNVYRVKFGADQHNPIKRIQPYLQCKREIIQIIKEEKPDMVYAEALDMLDIACAYKLQIDKNVKLVYEIADLHRYIIDPPNNIVMRFVHNILCKKDKSNCKQIELLVLTSEKFYDVYFNSFVPQKKTIFVPNMPNIHPLQEYVPSHKEVPCTIGFVGRIRYINECKLLIEACKRTGWKAFFAGGEDGSEIKMLCQQNGYEYFGEFDFSSQIKDIYEKCDVIYSVYDADMMNVRVALPNKLYEAIYCEKPIIVAKKTYLQEIVEHKGIGLAVEHDSLQEHIAALNRLQEDKKLYKALCDNCKRHKLEIDETIYSSKLKEKIIDLLS